MGHDAAPICDRRAHERFALLAQVHVKNAREDLVLELGNVSVSGALLLLGTLPRPSWVDVDRTIRLGIVHPISLDPVELSGRVVRLERNSEGLSFAVQFEDLTPAQQAQLGELTKLGRPRPPPLPR